MSRYSKSLIPLDSKALGYTWQDVEPTTGEEQTRVRLRHSASGVNAVLGRPYEWRRFAAAGSGEIAASLGAVANARRKVVVATAATVSGAIGEYICEGLCTAVASGTITAGDFVKVIGAAGHFISELTTESASTVGVARTAGTDGGTFLLDLYDNNAVVNT